MRIDIFGVALASRQHGVLTTRCTGESMGDKIKDKVGGMFGKDSSKRDDNY